MATESKEGEPEPPQIDPGEDGRFMQDQHGNWIHKWKIDYASRSGGGRAMCKDTDCLVRHEQGGVKFIEKGALRIGRRVLMKMGHEDEGSIHFLWFHARCMFNSFLRSRKSTRVICSPTDLENFENVDPEDQEMLKRFIATHKDARTFSGTLGRSGDGPPGLPGAAPGKRSLETPEKGIPGFQTAGAGGSGAGGSASKRQRLDGIGRGEGPKPGDRVWCFPRVRPAARPDGRPAQESAVKSSKAEVAKIVADPKDGYIIVQYEDKADEAERLAMYQNPRKKRIRGWLRYPRVFNGQKQRLPMNYIQWSRPPPRLCSCTRQEWGHECPCSGVSCSRGSTQKIWGVGQ